MEHAYRHRVALFAQGYYRTPEIYFDAKSATGRPFHYYAYGAAVAEVEAVLSGHPSVGDVAVIGVPDAEWGEQVKAVIATREACC